MNLELLVYIEKETGYFYYIPRNHKMTSLDLRGLECLSYEVLPESKQVVGKFEGSYHNKQQEELEKFFEAS